MFSSRNYDETECFKKVQAFTCVNHHEVLTVFEVHLSLFAESLNFEDCQTWVGYSPKFLSSVLAADLS